MIPIIGKLYREKNVSVYVYGRNMVNLAVTDIMKAHRFVRQIESNELSEFDTFPMISALGELDLGPAHIDIGKLTVQYLDQGNGQDREAFLDELMNQLLAYAAGAPQDDVALLSIEATDGGPK